MFITAPLAGPLAGLSIWLAELISAPGWASLAVGPMPPAFIARGNIYGVAFGYARRDRLGIDGAALARQLEQVSAKDLERCRLEVFAADKTSVAIVRIK